MNTEHETLFSDIPDTKPNRLRAARLAVEKAESEVARLRDTSPDYDQCPAPLKWEINEARMKLEDATAELKEAEIEELKK
jgi:hypothetical protein